MLRLPYITTMFVVTALLSVLAVGCSNGDDTGAVANSQEDTGASAADAAADVQLIEEYNLAQQFDLGINVTSSKFNRIRRIPRQYGCTEEDISPPITWSEVPEGTVSLALVVDSNQFPGSLWAHWVMWGIPPDVRELPEAVPNTPEALSIGPMARQGTNNDGSIGWSGPCPPPVRLNWGGPALSDVGKDPVKKYTFRLYALDTDIKLSPEATKEDLLRAIDGHILVGGELVGEQVSKTRDSGSQD